MYKAVIVGATGAVGSSAVINLLKSAKCETITTLGRRIVDTNFFEKKDPSVSQSLRKLNQIQVEMNDLNKFESETISAIPDGTAVAICTLGVGQPSKVSREEFIKIDVDTCTAFARACKKRGVRHIALLGSVGSDINSSLWYLKQKATVENNFKDLQFESCSLFRPSLLKTKEIRYGFQDKLVQTLYPLLEYVVPAKYHGIPVEDLGLSMVKNAEKHVQQQEENVVEVLEYVDFVKILKE